MKKLFIIIIVSVSIFSCNSGTTPTPNSNGVTIDKVSQIVHDSLHSFEATFDTIKFNTITTLDDSKITVDSVLLGSYSQRLYRINIINSEGMFTSEDVLLGLKEPSHTITVRGVKGKVINWKITQEVIISQ